MKSVIAQGSSIAKAIEEALKKADMPQEFFVKVLEDAQSGFLGFGSKKAKIALFFKNDTSLEKATQSMFEKGSYAGLFNNPEIKKQLGQQFKELGLENKPVEVKKQEVKPKPFKKEFKENLPIKKDFKENLPIKKDFKEDLPRISNLQIRPLGNKKPAESSHLPKSNISDSLFGSNLSSSDFFKDQPDQNQQEAKQGENKQKRYYRYRRNRYKNRSNNNDQGSFNSNKLGTSDKDE